MIILQIFANAKDRIAREKQEKTNCPFAYMLGFLKLPLQIQLPFRVHKTALSRTQNCPYAYIKLPFRVQLPFRVHFVNTYIASTCKSVNQYYQNSVLSINKKGIIRGFFGVIWSKLYTTSCQIYATSCQIYDTLFLIYATSCQMNKNRNLCKAIKCNILRRRNFCEKIGQIILVTLVKTLGFCFPKIGEVIAENLGFVSRKSGKYFPSCFHVSFCNQRLTQKVAWGLKYYKIYTKRDKREREKFYSSFFFLLVRGKGLFFCGKFFKILGLKKDTRGVEPSGQILIRRIPQC